MDEVPKGPQLSDADLNQMLRSELEDLGAVVGLDLQAAEALFADGTISREELRWVQSDAERVRNELIRRDAGEL